MIPKLFGSSAEITDWPMAHGSCSSDICGFRMPQLLIKNTVLPLFSTHGCFIMRSSGWKLKHISMQTHTYESALSTLQYECELSDLRNLHLVLMFQSQHRPTPP